VQPVVIKTIKIEFFFIILFEFCHGLDAEPVEVQPVAKLLQQEWALAQSW
jgi:hypothetical protein